MKTPRISASSYSNTAPLIWSFLYGSNHGKVEMILDNAPARSAQLLAEDRVDAALVPVIAYQLTHGIKLFPNVCVGAKERVRSVCLVTKGGELDNVKTVSLDVSSKTSVALTKIIFREFFGFEPEWRNAAPNIDAMLAEADAALLIGDPALSITDSSLHHRSYPGAVATGLMYRKFDLAELWKKYTGLGFVFAMWMSRKETCLIDFAAARDEGLAHIDEIATNYQTEIPIGRENLVTYLSENISYSIDDSMQKGLELYFELAQKNGLIDKNKPLEFTIF
jgi:chorismate dehydratase